MHINSIKKETLAQVFSCEFCQISKNKFSDWAAPVAASTLARSCSVKKVLSKVSDISQENACAGIPFLMKSQARILRLN